MRLDEITLPIGGLAEATYFYGTVLSLPVQRQDDAVVVAIGRSILRLIEDESARTTHHHLAFLIPSDQLDSAKEWISARAMVLGRGGVDEFEGPAGWNSRSVYFAGPNDSVLEFIVRRDLDNPVGHPFGPGDIIGITEVGVAVDDPLSTAATLQTTAGLTTYGTPDRSFAPVGDIDGLLILVTPGRVWFPTSDRPAVVSPTTIASSDLPAALRFGST